MQLHQNFFNTFLTHNNLSVTEAMKKSSDAFIRYRHWQCRAGHQNQLDHQLAILSTHLPVTH